VIHREPILDQVDAGTNKHFFKQRAGAQEFLVFGLGAKTHDVLHACAVVPTAVEQRDFARGGQMRNVALKIPLLAFAFGRRSQRDNAAHYWVETLGDALYDTALA